MASTAAQYLSELTTSYTPSSSNFDAARSHRSAIEARLDVYLGLHEMFETGSLRHGTGVRYYSDADFIVSLKGSQPGSEWTALNKVKETLQDRFPQTTIGVRRPAVVCHFSDAIVEVVPAYSDGAGYQIADPTGGWMKTHPKDHNKYVNDANLKHNGGVKTLARQAKIWKYKRNVPVSSCYLEMRAAKYMNGESSYAPVADLYYLLRHLQAVDLAAMNDPTGLGSRFTAYSSESNRIDAISKLNTAVTRAGKARDYANDGLQSLAIDQLKLLFDQ
jgi:hypothetical protein